ncbi:MAG: MFS transporter [Promethearchaeota archaeon]|jgi:MFS family permease
MNSETTSQTEEEKAGILKIVTRLWPNFLIYNSHAFTASMLFINIYIVAGIMWPGDLPNAFEMHAVEMGILTGSSIYLAAISGILFGVLADKFSRIRLMAVVELLYGFGLLLNGFVKEGQEQTTFSLFIIFGLIRGFSMGGFWPLISSYVNDSTEDKERSQFFGALQAIFQLFQVIGLLVSAIAFQNRYWQLYFIILGAITIFFGIIIMLRGKEPKRGATREELKDVLSSENVTYQYKLNKITIKSTILSPTNAIAFFEGIFTTILLSVPDFLMIAYLQSPPYNLTPTVMAIFMIIFGLPGGVLGSLIFAKISDRLGKRNIRNRIYMIVLSISILSIVYLIIFNVPIPNLSPTEGNDLFIIFTIPNFWILGLTALVARSVVGLWNINQPPVLQEINLPEAQGKISSANQFLEALGSGSGPIIAGLLLISFNQNFQITILITTILGIIGGLIWLLAIFWVKKDVARISSILKERGSELRRNS